jgi:hypothetical protein
MIKTTLQWTAPSPLWPEALGAISEEVGEKFSQPAILRFDTDAFMEEFLAVMEKNPAQLGGLVAQSEDWRGPTVTPESRKETLRPTGPVSSLARKLKRLAVARQRLSNPAEPAVAPTNNPNGSSLQASQLKLYQAAHQRYYLVAACLVCNQTGLPDRTLDPGHGERAAFVIRRLLPPEDSNIDQAECTAETCEEYAFVRTPDGSGWQRIAGDPADKRGELIPGEEQMPLFAVNFTEDDGRTRRLLAGLIPVGKREEYQFAGKYPPLEPEPEAGTDQPEQDLLSSISDRRMELFYKQVAGPWKSLIELAFNATRGLEQPDDPFSNGLDQDEVDKAALALLKTTREQLQTGSWYILLDFARFLEDQLQDIWKLIKDVEIGRTPSIPEQNLYNLLTTTSHTSAVDESTTTLAQALVKIKEFEKGLEDASEPYEEKTTPEDPWPGFFFAVADPVMGSILSPDVADSFVDEDTLRDALEKVDDMAKLVKLSLPDLPEAMKLLTPSLLSETPLDSGEGLYVIRCVFERPDCGPLHPPIISSPTQPFQMAGFFDPDAPARPIRIGLPIDVSTAGLRKFDKNTAFMLSDMLCGHINRFKKLSLGDLVRSVLPWPFHKDLPDFGKGPCKNTAGADIGMMCSFSIPIITICALILLMIIVNLLDMIFRWIPYFIVCFPLPGLKGKK